MDLFNTVINFLERLSTGEQLYIASIVILLAFIVVATTFTEKLQNLLFMGCISKLLKFLIVFFSIIYITLTLIGTLILDILDIHPLSNDFFKAIIITLCFTIVVAIINIRMIKNQKNLENNNHE